MEIRKNISIYEVNAVYSSQRYCSCGSFGNRKNNVFYCSLRGKAECSGHVTDKAIKSLIVKRLADKKKVAVETPRLSMNRVNPDLRQNKISGKERNIKRIVHIITNE